VSFNLADGRVVFFSMGVSCLGTFLVLAGKSEKRRQAEMLSYDAREQSALSLSLSLSLSLLFSLSFFFIHTHSTILSLPPSLTLTIALSL
jgi:hypothetical protein